MWLDFRKYSRKILLPIVLLGFSHVLLANTLDKWMDAARFGDTWTLSSFVFKGFDINTTNAKGNAALHAAMIEPNLASIDWLIKQHDINLNVRNAVGETALMQAIIHGHKDIALHLLKAGAAVNQTGWTPLHYAAASSAPTAAEFAKLLLDEYSAYVDAESPNGTTPLMMAARYGQLAAVQALLAGGADINLKNQQGLTALDFAEASEHPDNTKLIQSVFARQARDAAATQAKRDKLITPTAPLEPARTAPVVGSSTKSTTFETIPKGQW